MKYDVVVIGSGPGGYVAAIRAAQLGLKTACIEKDKTLGGTCLNVGCIPSKALLQSSEYYEFFTKHAEDHGIVAKEAKYDFNQMMKRKTDVVKTLTDGVEGLFKRNKVDWIKGVATIKSKNTIQVDKETFDTENIILATGSIPIELPFMKFDEKQIISSTGALSLQKVPKKMIVIGAGVIGVELASVYNRLGSEVTIVEMLERITPPIDLDISKALQKSLQKQGLTFHLNAQVTEAKIKKKLVEVILKDSTKYGADVVLVAVGRKAYTDHLGLENVGVATNRGLVPVNHNFQTAVPNVYAIGDIIDGPMLAHKASEEGYAAAEIIAGKKIHINYMGIPNVIYTHPEVASVGLSQEEAKEMGLQVIIGKCSYKGNARARCAGDTDGLVKIVGEAKSGKLIGMHIIGPHASEMIGEGVIAIEKMLTIEEVGLASHAHPTLSESIKEACLQALKRAVHI